MHLPHFMRKTVEGAYGARTFECDVWVLPDHQVVCESGNFRMFSLHADLTPSEISTVSPAEILDSPSIYGLAYFTGST